MEWKESAIKEELTTEVWGRKYVESHPHVPNFLEVIPAVRQARNATVVVCCSDPRLDIKQIFGVYQEPRSGELVSVYPPSLVEDHGLKNAVVTVCIFTNSRRAPLLYLDPWRQSAYAH